MINYLYRANGDEIEGVKSVTYHSAVNATTDLRPGCVSSSYITVEIFGSEEDAPADNERISVFRESAFVGAFYAEPVVRTRNTISFVAYDLASKLDVDFSARLAELQESFPMTLADIVSEACSVAGVQLDSYNFPMHTMTVNQFYAKGLSCRDILSYAAEIACCFVRVKPMSDYDDPEVLEFAWYTQNSDYRIYPSSGESGSETRIAYKQSGLSYSKYTISPPPQVAIKPSGVEGAAYIYPSNVSGVYATDPFSNGRVVLHNLIAIDDGNGNISLSGEFDAVDFQGDGNVALISSGTSTGDPMVITDNLLLTSATQATYTAVATNIFNRMNSIPAYRAASAALFPFDDPFICGEIIPVTDIQGISFYMLSMSATVGDAAAIINSTGNETRENEPENAQRSLTQLAADIVQINKLKVDWAEIDEAIINVVEANELKSSDFEPSYDGIYAANGMAINLAEKNIKAVDFAVDSDGKLYTDSADLAGVRIYKTYSSMGMSFLADSVEGGYTMYGSTSRPIPYRTLRSISIRYATSTAFNAKFEYYNEGTIVETIIPSEQMPVDGFAVPFYNGAADGVRIGLVLAQGEDPEIDAVVNAITTPHVDIPSLAIVNVSAAPMFEREILVDGVTIDSDSYTKSSHFTVNANGSTVKTIPASSFGMIAFSGVGAGLRGLYFFSCDSNNSVSITAANAASSITITTGTGRFTATNSSSDNAHGIIIYF